MKSSPHEITLRGEQVAGVGCSVQPGPDGHLLGITAVQVAASVFTTDPGADAAAELGPHPPPLHRWLDAGFIAGVLPVP